MLKKLICLLWGHKTTYKAYTGQRYDAVNQLTGEPFKGHYYVVKRSPFCQRCGKDVKQ